LIGVVVLGVAESETSGVNAQIPAYGAVGPGSADPANPTPPAPDAV
jgi:hypothetical protein